MNFVRVVERRVDRDRREESSRDSEGAHAALKTGIIKTVCQTEEERASQPTFAAAQAWGKWEGQESKAFELTRAEKPDKEI